MKKRTIYVFNAILALLILSSPLTIAHANNDYHSFHEQYDELSDESKEEVKAILHSLKSDLIDLGMTFPKSSGFHEKFNQLDEKSKEKVEEILDEFEEKKLTKEKANEQLKPYGLELPDKDKCNLLEDLDNATKKKAQDIYSQLKNGSISKEEAEKQLKELGITIPKNPLEESFNKLNEETKNKVILRVNKAKEQLDTLGVPLPHKYNFLLK